MYMLRSRQWYSITLGLFSGENVYLGPRGGQGVCSDAGNPKQDTVELCTEPKIDESTSSALTVCAQSDGFNRKRSG